MKDIYLQIQDELNKHVPDLIRDFPTRHSGVCIPLLDTAEGPAILFEVRSSRLNSQPGDICFPGGMAEEGENPYMNALREICEELLIREEDVKLLGGCDQLMIGNLLVTPFVVHLQNYSFTSSPDEVAEVFTVPLSWFAAHPAEIYTLNFKPDLTPDFPIDRIRGGADYRFRPRREKVYFYQYQDRCIWGMTAGILHAFMTTCERGIL